MKIVINMTSEDADEIMAIGANHCHSLKDIEINVIDALDAYLDLPGYDVEIEIGEGE